MVSRLIFLFLLPTILFSGEFTASVISDKVNLGESFTLTLTLKDATAKGVLNLEVLKPYLTLASEKQMFSTTMINGTITSSTTWKITLISQKEGEVTVPSISVNTPEGTYSTEPIKIDVVKRSESSKLKDDDVILTSEVSNESPYKNEPFVYKVKLISKKNMVDVKVQNFALENALVELHGEPKVYQKKVDEANVGIIEFYYLITPLKPGALRIPPHLIQGSIPGMRKASRGMFFDDDIDPFALLQGYDQLKSFSLVTEEITLNILAPVPGINPWLPATSLKIEEIWNDSQIVQAGEPITRGIKIIAEGVKSSQLPSLSEFHANSPHFKIYADKPEVIDSVKEGTVTSFRTENYTLIPQSAGELTLPPVSITWWDVVKKEKVITQIPTKKLNVLPFASLRPSPSQDNNVSEIQGTKDYMLYALIGMLVIVLMAAIFWALMLQKKLKRLNEAPIEKKNDQIKVAVKAPKKDKQEKLPDLNPT